MITRATLPKDIDFRGTVFPTGTVVDSRYLFDGYRASYLYRLVNGERFTWDIGASVQIRNALVSLGAVDGTTARHPARMRTPAVPFGHAERRAPPP